MRPDRGLGTAVLAADDPRRCSVTTESPVDLVATAPRTIRDPLCWLPLTPHDQPLVLPGAKIAAGDPLVERRLPGGQAAETVESVVGGSVRSLDRRGICVEAHGLGLPGAVAFGQPVRGQLMVAVPDRYSELRASSIDVSVAGAILLAGAEVGIEALTRARALGARGVICGGIVGKELGRFVASDARQRASLRSLAPFGLVCLDGYGNRPISTTIWRQLASATAEEVALSADPPMVILEAGKSPTVRARRGSVRVTNGAHIGREGSLLGLRGLVGCAGTGLHPAALVALSGSGMGRPAERLIVALADLERLD